MNTLYYGDNLDILRNYIANESVDLIYLDPPFNSNRDYNVLFKDESSGVESQSQITAFEDTWHWDIKTEAIYRELITADHVPSQVSSMIAALRDFIGANQMMAYLVNMTIRLVELHRVLKSTGSLYLHCDPTASHYLKIVLDSIFGIQNYRNEIVWKRTSSHSDAKRYPKITDTIFYYSKTKDFVWNKQYGEYNENYVKTHYSNTDLNGKRFRYDNLVKPKGSVGYFYTLLGCNPPPNGWRMPESRAVQWLNEGKIEIPPTGKIPAFKRFLDEMQGTVVGNLWSDIPPINSQAKDSLGYPTQKPQELLERIINASSNPGDVCLDPFCGCGTAIAAAQATGRQWIGIDITHLSIALIKYRMLDSFPTSEFKIIGEPESNDSARYLAEADRHQFEWWALSLIRARPGQPQGDHGKKGADQGIDGIINFIDDASGKPQKAIVQVKSGHVNSAHIRDLVGTINRVKAPIGIYLTLEPPTGPMKKEAAEAGFYHSNLWNKDYPRIQIYTVEELLKGKTVDLPPSNVSFTKAQRQKTKGDTSQMSLLGLSGDEE